MSNVQSIPTLRKLSGNIQQLTLGTELEASRNIYLDSCFLDSKATKHVCNP